MNKYMCTPVDMSMTLNSETRTVALLPVLLLRKSRMTGYVRSVDWEKMYLKL